MTGASGWRVWISTSPGLAPRPGAARDLRDLLVGPLGRAQVAAFEPEVGIDHAHQRQFGEMEALGDELGADDHVDRPAFRLGDEFRRALGRIERVAR